MLNDFWKQFKSGTDIRGVAVPGAGYDVNLTDETVTAIVNGFILWLSEKTGKKTDELKVAIGRDSRISGKFMLDISAAAMVKAGIQVIDCDLASTPAMFMTTVEMSCDGALQLTASHHPYYRNGLKFFTREGGLNSEDIVAILEFAQKGALPAQVRGGKRIDSDFMNRYAFILREKIKKEVNSSDDYHHPLKGFRIVVDAGNGVGGFFATDVLEALGADIRGSQFLEPDGMFPNHIPNPENASAMAAITEAVKKAGADLGVIFDTDVDRGGAVDSDGNEINRNRLVALAAAIALENNKGGMVVTDSITSDGLKEFIEKNLGGKHLRFKRGYKNVINEAVAQNNKGVNCPLAIETSGHAAMRENYFLDDGAYLVTKIIIKMAQLRNQGKKLNSIIADLKEPVESKEIRIKITEKNFREYGEKVIAALTKYAEKEKTFAVADDNHEGIRVSFNKANGDGWFLLRLSVHDPIMPLNIESNTNGGVDKIYAKIQTFLAGCEGLDTFDKKAKITVPVKEEVKKSLPSKASETKPAVKAAETKAETKPAAKAAETKAETKPAVKAAETKAETKPAAKATETKAETKPAAKAAETKAETKPAAKAAETKAETKPAAKVAETKAETKPAAKVAETKAETKPAAKVAETKAETKPAAKVAETKAETKPAAKVAETKVETKPAAKAAETKAETKPAAKAAETKVETKPDVKAAETKAETKTAAKAAETKAETKSDAKAAETKAETKPTAKKKHGKK